MFAIHEQTSRRLLLPEIEQRLCEIVSKQLGIPRKDVFPSSRLIEDLHCDSLDLIELFMLLEEAFSVTLPEEPPNAVYKSVFIRQPFRLSDLAEIVYLQQGTGAPQRAGWRNQIEEAAPSHSIPFTQLNGRWDGAELREQRLLLEPLATEQPFRQFRRLTDGMRCVLLPSAKVELGANTAESLPDERPVHSVELDSFLMDAEPVSTTAYCRFLNSIGTTPAQLDDWFLLEPNDHRRPHLPIELRKDAWQPVQTLEQVPMVLVSWYGANAYALWANGRQWMDYQHRDEFLPSEAQWEYATQEAKHPLTCARHEPGHTYEVEALPLTAVNALSGMSPFGLHHMAGNVWHWCRDWYAADFYQAPEAREKNPVNRANTGVRSERGGSWVGPAELCRSSYRRGRAPHARGRCLGFRCVISPTCIPGI